MTKDMTQGSPLRLILAFAVPLMLGSLFQQFYNLADTIIVGRFVGVEALAAVGSVGGLNYLVLGFVNGIACGFSIPISWTFGAKDYREMRRYTANAVWLSLFFAAVLTVVTVAMTRSILVWTNTQDNIIDLADVYIRTIFVGIPFTLLYNMTSALMRALGDSKRPLYFLLVASFLNIGLDLLCIIVFRMGAFGAAFATVFSQAVAGLGSLLYILKHYGELRWSREEGQLSRTHCAKLCSMGIPMGLQCSITAIGSVVLQGAVNGLGSDIVAAQTAGGKAAQFLCVPLESIGTAMTTYASQNMGAHDLNRVNRASAWCTASCPSSSCAWRISPSSDSSWRATRPRSWPTPRASFSGTVSSTSRWRYSSSTAIPSRGWAIPAWPCSPGWPRWSPVRWWASCSCRCGGTLPPASPAPWPGSLPASSSSRPTSWCTAA